MRRSGGRAAVVFSRACAAPTSSATAGNPRNRQWSSKRRSISTNDPAVSRPSTSPTHTRDTRGKVQRHDAGIRLDSYLFGANAPYVEELYEDYLDDPGSVPEHWREYFDQLQHSPAPDGRNSVDVSHAPIVTSFAQRARDRRLTPPNAAADGLATSRSRSCS